MIFHLLLNSFFVFIVLAFLVESILFLFQIKNSRMRYFCRLLPILKLPLDLLVFSFFNDPLVNFNPLSCQLQVQEWLMNQLPSFAQIELKGFESVIIPSYLASLFPAFLMRSLISGTIALSLVITLWKGLRLTQSLLSLRKLISSATPSYMPINNDLLKRGLEQSQVTILISRQIEMPFAVGYKSILFPSHLLEVLSQAEYEAVVAHELEHLKWKDPLVKLLSTSICDICWWLPTRRWIDKLELEQEKASDEGVTTLGLDKVTLATALLKALKQAKTIPYEAALLCPLSPSRQTHLIRLENILNSEKQAHPLGTVVALLLIIAGSLSFWMC